MECNKAKDGKGGDSGEGVEDKVDEKKDSAAKTTSQSLIPLDDANAFSTEDFCKAFNESPEAQALRMVFRDCNVLFLKQVEMRLSSLVWDAYQFLANTKSVVVNVQASKPEVKVKVPIPDDLCLPLVGGKVSPFKTPGSMFLCHFFGVSWQILMK